MKPPFPFPTTFIFKFYPVLIRFCLYLLCFLPSFLQMKIVCFIQMVKPETNRFYWLLFQCATEHGLNFIGGLCTTALASCSLDLWPTLGEAVMASYFIVFHWPLSVALPASATSLPHYYLLNECLFIHSFIQYYSCIVEFSFFRNKWLLLLVCTFSLRCSLLAWIFNRIDCVTQNHWP